MPAETDGPVHVASAVPVYYVADQPGGPRLFREFHSAGHPEGEVAAALAQMLSAPAYDPDYRSLWPAGTTVESIRRDGDTVEVWLSGPPVSDAELAVQQVVYTVTAADNDVDLVLVGVAGEPFMGGPNPRAARTDVEGLLWLTSPGQGASVPTTFTIEGQAAAYEGVVTWQALDGSGAVVAEGHTTTSGGMGVKSDFAAEVTLAPGTYTLRVIDYGGSGEPERATYDTKTVTVR